LRKNARKNKRRNCLLLTVTILLLSGVVGIMVVFKYARHISLYHSPGILGRAKAAKAMVRIDPDTGVYSVDWDGDGAGDEEYATKIDTATTTFSELAEIMLQPWYEASLMAVMDDKVWTSSTGITPSNVSRVRKVMLMTRDLLDAFSPVFPNKSSVTTTKSGKKGKRRHTKETDTSLWKKLRTMYKDGYKLIGELKDLNGLAYSQELLETRVHAVLEWKVEFVAFQRNHRIRRFLYSHPSSGGGIDPTGCYHHAASHLFWTHEQLEEEQPLPCGNDIGTVSLRSLASVQLTHSLNYLQEIRSYTTVMPEKHELQFHNLRKELRTFRDEYNLFGKVLVASSLSSSSEEEDGDNDKILQQQQQLIQEELTILDEAQFQLGFINDNWAAHDIYVIDNNSHPKEQKLLAIKIDKLWATFLVWQDDNDLQGCIENMLERME